MIELTEAEKAALREVVTYCWASELADYEQQDEAGRAHHVFNHLKVLEELVSRLPG